jgi:hypothetical protein
VAAVNLSLYLSRLFRVTPVMAQTDIARGLAAKGVAIADEDLADELLAAGAEQIPGVADHWRMAQTELEAQCAATRLHTSELVNASTNACEALEDMASRLRSIADLASTSEPTVAAACRALADSADARHVQLDRARRGALEHLRQS